MAIAVRSYRAADEQAVVALWDLVFPNDPAWNQPLEMIQRKMLVQPELFFVCEAHSKIVGTALAGFDGVRGWVHKVATHPAHRRMGIARQLMQAAEAGLVNKGCTKFNLQVREGNDSAVALYQQIGFTIEPRTSMSKQIGRGSKNNS